MKRSTALLLLALGSAGAFVAVSCVEGTTPDCSSPEAGCGPGVDGAAFDASEAGDATGDSSSDATPDSAIDSGGGSDGGGDAASDAADARG